MKKFLAKCVLLMGLGLPFLESSAQDSRKDKEAALKQIVESGNFVFHAQTVFPQTGMVRQLTSEYEVRISKDSLVSHLPYFGRAYSAPVYPSDGGIQFTSTDFTYASRLKKKRGWQITIKPKDTRDVRQMYLTVSPNGTASLQVNSNNRQSISFNGYISERK